MNDETDTWMVERMRKGDGHRLDVLGPLTVAELVGVLDGWLPNSLTGGIVIYRTPQNAD